MVTEAHESSRSPREAVLVTGGMSGIGLAIALQFVAEGQEVYILSRRGDDNAQELNLLVETRGIERPHVLKADVADRDRLKEIAAELAAADVPLRTVVAAAGTNVRALALDVADEAVRSMIDINLYGLFATFQIFAPLVLKRTGGRFIAIGSVSGEQGMRLRAPYSATKAGVSGLVRALAVEWGPLGATVNAIAPGFIETPLTRGYMQANPDRTAAALAHTAVGRFGTPADVAHAASFLASKQAGFVNGHTLVIDGGLTAGSSWW